jgi:peptidoglycan/LPS O-acetylase OafA/YrhL
LVGVLVPSSPHIAALDGVRGAAIALVVLFHAFPTWLPGGFIGVDVFFVLSGFLTAAGLMRERAATGRVAIGAFFRRRAARLLPALAVMLVADVAYEAIADGEVGPALIDGALVLAGIANWSLAFGFDRPGLLAHCWTLSIEEQFYLLAPTLALLLVRRWRVAGLLLFAAVIAEALWRRDLALHGSSPMRVFEGLDTRIGALFIGMLLAALQHHGGTGWRRIGAAATILGPIAACGFLYAAAVLDWTDVGVRVGGFEAIALGAGLVIVAAAAPRANTPATAARLAGAAPARRPVLRPVPLALPADLDHRRRSRHRADQPCAARAGAQPRRRAGVVPPGRAPRARLAPAFCVRPRAGGDRDPLSPHGVATNAINRGVEAPCRGRARSIRPGIACGLRGLRVGPSSQSPGGAGARPRCDTETWRAFEPERAGRAIDVSSRQPNEIVDDTPDESLASPVRGRRARGKQSQQVACALGRFGPAGCRCCAQQRLELGLAPPDGRLIGGHPPASPTHFRLALGGHAAPLVEVDGLVTHAVSRRASVGRARASRQRHTALPVPQLDRLQRGMPEQQRGGAGVRPRVVVALDRLDVADPTERVQQIALV